MSHTSQLSRYRPAVAAITGVAAAYGIYILYYTYAEQPTKGGLHRSNAVHRGRSERPSLPSIDTIEPEPDSPLGNLVINSYPRDIVWDIANQGTPLASDLRPRLGLSNDMDTVFQLQLDSASIQCILQACLSARSPAERRRLDRLGLDGARLAIAARDVPRLQGEGHRIQMLMPHTTMDLIVSAIEHFAHTPAFISSDDSDLMTYAETEDVDDLESDDTEPSQGLKGLLYHIAEADAKRKAYEHRGIHCEGCGEGPIRGIRWHCLNCPDYDLCSSCEADNGHVKTHVFVKIRVPLPVLSQPTKESPLWYPGDPRKRHPPLKATVRKQLQENYGYDAPQIDALYDQFTCIANMPWARDPNDIKAAIDRRAFDKALTSERWPQRFKPNLVYDRMFDFYDTNNDKLIGFEEFVDGMAYLRGQKRFTPLSRALKGFDVDGDGFVERKDFVRMFRAKHEIQKLLVADMVQCHEAEDTRRAMDTLRSTQPISSIFSIAELPPGEERTPGGKVLRNGDMEPQDGTKTTLEDNEGWSGAENNPHWRGFRQPHELLQHNLSRFEELVDASADEGNGVVVVPGPSSLPDRAQDNEQANGTATSSKSEKIQDRTSHLGGNDDNDTNVDVNSDVLWHFIEDGYHEMLDPLFEEQERADLEVKYTTQERQRNRLAINNVLKEQRKAKKNKRNQEALNDVQDDEEAADPLIATAMSSATNLGPFVRTDAASLTRREQHIREQSLNGLLSATGYHRVDDGEADGLSEADSDSDAEFDGFSHTTSSEESFPLQDPTMPQNMPNSTPAEPDSPVPRRCLEHYVKLNRMERQIKLRGGPGRLSFAEVEQLVHEDVSRRLRGLVISWLEWASF